MFRDPADAESAALRTELDAIGPWSDRMKPTWLVETSLSSRQLRDRLKVHLKPNDRIFVAEMSRNWAAGGMGAGFGEWMRRRVSVRRSHGPVRVERPGLKKGIG